MMGLQRASLCLEVMPATSAATAELLLLMLEFVLRLVRLLLVLFVLLQVWILLQPLQPVPLMFVLMLVHKQFLLLLPSDIRLQFLDEDQQMLLVQGLVCDGVSIDVQSKVHMYKSSHSFTPEP